MSNREPQTIPMVLNRDHVMRTMKGHHVGFKKDVPVPVPKIVYGEAIAIGAIRADGNNANVIEETALKPPMTNEDRAELLTEAIKSLMEKNERDDFTTTGQPTVAAVLRETGEKFDVKEVGAAWKKVTAGEE